jgi:hypothetical protein
MTRSGDGGLLNPMKNRDASEGFLGYDDADILRLGTRTKMRPWYRSGGVRKTWSCRDSLADTSLLDVVM